MKKKLFVFESNPDFADNSRGFWEYVKNKDSIDTVWCVRDENVYKKLNDQGIKSALFGTEEAKEVIDCADCFITSSFEFAYYKKKNQLHVSAWHGFPLKLIGYFDSATENTDFSNLKVITAQSDLITATSRFCQLTMSGMFSCDPNKVKITGFPRNDLLFIENGRKNLNKLVDLKQDSKLIFYLPTMRKGLKDEGEAFNHNIFNYMDYDADQLDAFLEQENAYIITKMHFADQKFYTENDFELPKRMIFLDADSMNDELLTIYHIMNAFDVLITDYSSVYVDYLLLDRPIVFSCPDLEKYKKDRGFVVDDPSLLMPGEKVKSQKGLMDSLHNCLYGKDDYKVVRHEKMSYFHTYMDGNASERLFNEIQEKLEKHDYDLDKQLGQVYFPNRSELYTYFLNIDTEVYFDRGSGLNEKDKETIHKEIMNGELLKFKFTDLQDVNYVRFDPDYSGHWIIEDLTILCNGTKISYTLFNGLKEKDTIYLLEEDPQILIDLHGMNVSTLTISFKLKDAYIEKNSTQKIINRLVNDCHELDHVKEELTNIKNSKFWKVYQRIGK